MNVVGLDLSLAATGVAHADGTTSTIKTSLRGIDRIEKIVDTIMAGAIDGTGIWAAELVVMEDALFGMRNHTTGELLMLHGCLRLAFHREGIQWVVIAPATLKKFATGAGNAKKPDMRMELYKRAGIDLADDNQVDAWWLRAAALDHYGESVVAMPQANRVALDKVEWPPLPVADLDLPGDRSPAPAHNGVNGDIDKAQSPAEGGRDRHTRSAGAR